MSRNFAAALVRLRDDGHRRSTHAASILLVCALPLLAGPAGAQGAPASIQALPGPLVAGQGEATKTEASQRPNWVITPSVSVEGTYTDNVNLSTNKKSDFITMLSPGITLDGKSARASASLNYQWQYYAYADNSDLGHHQRSLTARGQLELVEQWLFIEGNQNISQQYASTFGTKSVGNELVTSNRTETSAYSISPYIKGRLANFADYQLRYVASYTSSDSGGLSGDTPATTQSWSGQLTGATRIAPLAWSVNLDHQVVHNTNGFESIYDRASGTLSYQIDPQVRLLARAGRASENFTVAGEQKHNTGGLGLDWAPTERTSVSLKKGQDAGGNAHSVDFSHRTALSAWKFSDSRGVVVPTSQMAQAQSGTAYDLVYLQLASSFPDPAVRAAEANRLLAQAGIQANAPIYGPLQTSQPYIERRQSVSLALMGVNNTVTFAADRSTSERFGTAGIALADDFVQNENIRQSGFNASWAHKMTPHAALTLNAYTSRSTGSANLETTLKAWSLMLSTQLGARTFASLSLRQSRFDSTEGGNYDEQALIGAMQITF